MAARVKAMEIACVFSCLVTEVLPGVVVLVCFLLVLFGSKGEMGQSIVSQLEHIKSIYIQYNRLDHEKRISGLNITSVDLRGFFTVIGILPWLKKC